MLTNQSINIGEYELTKELDYLCASYLFCNKPQMCRLLKYLVENCLNASDHAYDQRAIAMESLGRGDDFDPAENPVVRIEIGRLRRLLNNFYEEELGRAMSITIPLGQYRPKISQQQIPTAKYPKFAVAPTRPERLSLLLQLVTEGDESSELYLLRHQARIGLTIALGENQAVRLVVALPDERGKLPDSIDFIMRVSVSSTSNYFTLESKIILPNSGEVLFKEGQMLPSSYDKSSIDGLLQYWASAFCDLEVGLLWPVWIQSRLTNTSDTPSSVDALIKYQRYLRDETEEHLREALIDVREAVKRYPGDNVINFALADLYYRDLIHGFGVSDDPLAYGLAQVREALRFNPGCLRLHTLLALFALIGKEYNIAEMELRVVKEITVFGYSTRFHALFLQCLMSEWDEGVSLITAISNQFSRHSKLYPVIAYLNAWFQGDSGSADEWRQTVLNDQSEASVRQCLRFMRLPYSWRQDGGSAALLIRQINEHLDSK